MSRRPLPGMATALVFGLITGLGHGFFYIGVSAFLKPWTLELDISRTQAAAAVAFGRLNAGWMTLLAGGLADRLGPRQVAAMGCALAAIGFAMSAWCQEPWQLALAWGGLGGLGTSMAFTVVLDKALMRQVAPAQHGRAIGTRFAAIAVSSFLSATATGLIVHQWSWRVACLVWAVVIVACLLAVLRLIPQEAGPDAARPDTQQGLSLAEVWRTGEFRLIALISALQAGVQTGVVVHLAAMLTDVAVPNVHVAMLVGAMVLLSLPGRLLAGWCADRLAIAPLAAGVSLAIGLQALVLLWHGLAPSPVSAYLFPLLYGLAWGFPTPVLILMQSRRFGTRHFGAIQGAILLVQSAVSVLVPLGLGLCFDLSGQYRWGLCAAAALLLGAAALAWRLRRLPAGLRPAHAFPSLA